jgi:hypothetical protein
LTADEAPSVFSLATFLGFYLRLFQNFSFGETGFAYPVTLKKAVL